MDSNRDQRADARGVQFGIADMLLIVAVIAWVLWMSIAISPLVIAIAAIPFSFLIEHVCRVRTTSAAPVRNAPSEAFGMACAACAVSAAGVSCFSFLAGQASDWYAPWPLLTALPNMALWQLGGTFGLPGMMLCLATFAILNHDILKSAAPRAIPLRFVSMLGIATFCSIIWLAGGWSYAASYHGWHYTFTVTAINVVWLVALWVLWFWLRRSAGNWQRLAFSTFFQYWLFGMAFPWLGEYP